MSEGKSIGLDGLIKISSDDKGSGSSKNPGTVSVNTPVSGGGSGRSNTPNIGMYTQATKKAGRKKTARRTPPPRRP